MAIKTAPMASGASGLPLRTAAPMVNTRNSVPMASVAYFVAVLRRRTRSGSATTWVADSNVGEWVAWVAVVMPIRLLPGAHTRQRPN